MTDNILISIVIITYNKLEYLKAVLQNLVNLQGHRNVEFIVVNDGSSDGTDEFLKGHRSFINVKHITIQNSGSAVARNTGIHLSKGEYILFLDDDIIICPEYINFLRKSISESPNMIHAGKIRLIPLEKVPLVFIRLKRKYWINKDFLERNSYVDAIYGTLDIAYKSNPDAKIACWWGLATGGNICFPRHVIEESGYFDENFRNWGPEDIDLFYRAFKKNYFLKYNEKCKLYHLDHNRDDKKVKENLAKNISKLLKKYMSNDILSYLQFFNGMLSLNIFNQTCAELHKLEKLMLPEHYISLDYYIKKDQIINWKKAIL